MKKLVLTFLLLAGAPAFAQQVQMMQPTAADPSHPGTQVATAVAEALLTADAEAAASRIAALAAPAYRDGALAADVRGFTARVGAPGAYSLDTAMLGPDGILVVLREAGEGGNVIPVMVQMEHDAPHRVTGLRGVQVRMRQPD